MVAYGRLFTVFGKIGNEIRQYNLPKKNVLYTNLENVASIYKHAITSYF